MKRLIVVSNRLPSALAAVQGDARSLGVGGLESALHAALQRSAGSLWFGWNGDQRPDAASARLTRRTLGGVRVVGMPLTANEIDLYYRGASNSALWPLCHSFQGRVKLSAREFAGYREVNERFAAKLMPLLRPGDIVWIHDYQLMEVGAALRRLGFRGRLGFFLHVPFPGRDLWDILPDPAGMLESLLEHDVIGFQTQEHLDNYLQACRGLLGASWRSPLLAAGSRRQRAGVFAVGIDPEVFLPRDSAAAAADPSELKRVVRGRALLFGVDRLDYTKGIEQRILAFEHLIRTQPQWRNRISMIQVAAPSRSHVREYVEHAKSIEALVGRVNGALADHDWVPIRYLHRSYKPEVLAAFYRAADVGLVTPLRDGMNLVAKEFVAAQDPADPGVLVLSRFAGAASELHDAVLVNPYILPSDVADGIARALAMPLAERRRRHRRLLSRVLHQTASRWTGDFIAALAGTAARRHPRTAAR